MTFTEEASGLKILKNMRKTLCRTFDVDELILFAFVQVILEG